LQAHIVSVILDVLNPEQKEEEDFHIQIEKDPAQEDFLQGRMTGNPYKSTDAGLGPLMRDIKNKICRDTEMIALMEDDNGMELLVNNQIISLSLPVRAVYDKIWKKANPGQPMVIVYRMRGLLGDAVESFVSTLGEADGGKRFIDCFVLLRLITLSLTCCDGKSGDGAYALGLLSGCHMQSSRSGMQREPSNRQREVSKLTILLLFCRAAAEV
uniref:E3_UbLigase_R4 domain-containing protein n=1 Tax=Heligmosomoides polygyrus TaxID=6339 RepID=A0A183FG44_HELPZ